MRIPWIFTRFIQEIEETFEIAIPEEEAEKIKTVGEAVELIRKTRNE